MVLWGFLVGLIGARLGFWLAYGTIPLSAVPKIWEGGLLSYTGILAGALTLWWYLGKYDRENRLRWLDLCFVVGVFAWGVGRIGNYYAADSVGVLSSVWHLTYGRVPIQLFEMVVCWLIAWLGLRLLDRLPAGRTAWFVILCYLAARFSIDGWRDETSMAGLHMSQWFCLVSLVILIPLYIRHARSKN